MIHKPINPSRPMISRISLSTIILKIKSQRISISLSIKSRQERTKSFIPLMTKKKKIYPRIK